MEDFKIWNAINEAWNELAAHFEPVIDEMVAGSSLDRQMWSLLIGVLSCEPDATTTGDLLVRSPFTAPDEYLRRLELAAQQGYLSKGEMNYRLTEEGRREVLRLVAAARDFMSQVDPLPASDSKRLAALLDHLVQSSLSTPPPPNTWRIRRAIKLMPDPDPPLPYIEQAITCLSAYRDDSHLAAWRFSGLSATTLETLTLLWRGEANTMEELWEKLSYRGHPRQVYTQSVEDLKERNFVKGSDHELMVTEGGRLLRNQIEADTDRFFFKPWSSLSFREKTDLLGLMIRLRDGLISQRT